MDLKEIQKPVRDLLDKTDSILMEEVKSDIKLINRISQLTPVTKGKKIRSTLLFLLAGLTNNFTDDLPTIASSCEMLHLSSLIHDDIVDNSELRRGEKTLNCNLGNYISVLWGDYLFIDSLNILKKVQEKIYVFVILEASKSMIEGQLIESENQFNFDINIDTYYRIIQKKTSSLFVGISEIAAALTDDSQDSIKKYRKFGLDFGTIFQISDDMLDIFSNSSGKDRFRDLKEGKITLPFMLLFKECKEDIRPIVIEGNQEQLLKLFEKYKIKELSIEVINSFHQQCLLFLDAFPDSVYKKSLIHLLDFIVYRDY
jgi:octaprenyl-diphosphate synthase